METARMLLGSPPAASTATGATGVPTANGAADTGAAGKAGFFQTLAQVMQNGQTGADTGSSGALPVASVPGMLIGLVEGATQKDGTNGPTLDQLIAMLLQAAQQKTADASGEGSDLRDFDWQSLLAELQALLMQVTVQAQPTQQAEARQDGAFLQLDADAAGKPSTPLMTLLAEWLETQNGVNEKKHSLASFAELIKPLLAELTARAAQTSTSAGAHAQTAAPVDSMPQQSMPAVFDGLRSLHRKSGQEGRSNSANTVPVHLVQVVNDGAAQSALNRLAAKFQPLVQVVAASGGVSGSTEQVQTQAAIAPEPLSAASEETNAGAQQVFRMPTASEPMVQTGEKPVIHGNRFAQEMGQLLKSMNLNQTGGHSEIRITLMPEHLGQVDVKLSMHNGQLIAQFVAGSVHGKDLLESQLPQLRAVLQDQGLQVDRLEVKQGGSASFGMFQDQKGQQQSSQQFQRQSSNESSDWEETSALDFEGELSQLNERKVTLDGAGTFDVSA
ncbi:flagellar hook-length control protein FliK [Paenibacillus koleovorans]|uniref:flagellar hook-length control protein FliK n=1 Tax=Paenibacillus koleovorans TaxID=121608 RepID=UPI000FDAB2FB|nr:flagellar hook-length control protein FliK [Paenibacillus koleovorans]